MHMADALISPAVGGAFWAASLSAIAYSSRKLKQEIDEKLVPLTGVLAAFVFAAQMINFAIPGTGSSGHIGGGLLLAILLGPHAAFIAMASVLVVQALFFADGGLLALGCNIWNLGFYSCFVAYPLVYRPIAGNGGRAVFAVVVSAIAALQLGAFSVVLQTVMSGISELPFKVFVSFMQPIHLAIGIVEGVVTAGAVSYVWAAGWRHEDAAAVNWKKTAAVILLAAMVVGGVFSWFASSKPDGLEWSIGKTSGREEIEGRESGAASFLAGLQKKTAVLPDYGFGGSSEQAVDTWPAHNTGSSVSAVAGGAIVIAFVFAAGFLIRMFSGRKKAG
ncbi:MAG: energy-coupling factor ABC transporter permease [Nitrospirae bacterium]|nr:energy-coupling factor ABC transporter permease [Nitrospirota bacterium]